VQARPTPLYLARFEGDGFALLRPSEAMSEKAVLLLNIGVLAAFLMGRE
jgi:hypothetical protein